MTDGLTDAVYRGLPDDAIWACIRERLDEAALRAFLHRHGGRLLASARAFTVDDATAQDAVQEAMIRLVRDRAKLSSHGAAMAWLYVAVDRTARGVRRAERRRKAREEQVSFARPEGVSASDSGAGELRDVVGRAVAELPARERRAVELVYFEGLTHAAAAAALGWSRGAVGSYLTRALRRLEGLLAKRGVTAAGGVVAIETSLLADTPSGWPDAVWTLAAARRATEESVMQGWVTAAKLKAFAVVVLCGGTTVGGLVWAFTPSAQPHGAPIRTAQSKPESVRDRNERIFNAVVLEKQRKALGKLLLGKDGEVRLQKPTEFFDCRMKVVYELRHDTGEPLPQSSVVEIYFDADSRMSEVFFDLFGDGNARGIDPVKPILWRVLGREMTFDVQPLSDALRAFENLPQDQLTAKEATAQNARLEATCQPYLGVWFRQGDANAPCQVTLNAWVFSFKDDKGNDIVAGGHRRWLRMDATRQLRGCPTLSPLMDKLTFESGDWWTRKASK